MSAATGVGTALRQGVLLKLDKPAGPTSHDVVHAVRRHLGVRRVGHAGTLDPQATGLLVVGIGPATRLLSYVASQDKGYRGALALGVRTDTLDGAGREVARRPWPRDADRVRAVAEELTGVLVQRPPMVSAVKVGGERLYKLAARGLDVERPERRVTVRRLDVLDMDLEEGRVTFEIDCSSGTYVRALVDTWGERLGSYAHLASLRRTRVGAISVEGAFPAARLAPRGRHPAGSGAKRGDPPPEGLRGLETAVLPWDVALSHLPRRELTPAEADGLAFGRAPRSRGETGTLRLEDEENGLLAIAAGVPRGLPLELRCVLVGGGRRW